MLKGDGRTESDVSSTKATQECKQRGLRQTRRANKTREVNSPRKTLTAGRKADRKGEVMKQGTNGDGNSHTNVP